MIQVKIFQAFALTTAATLALGVPASVALAAPKDKPEKIKICHATGSESNPYVLIEVDEDGANGNGKNDHTSHEGDLIPAPEWGCPEPEVEDPDEPEHPDDDVPEVIYTETPDPNPPAPAPTVSPGAPQVPSTPVPVVTTPAPEVSKSAESSPTPSPIVTTPAPVTSVTPTSTPTLTPSPSPSASNTPTPVVSVTPTPIVTAVPTATPTVTPTSGISTPIATQVPEPTSTPTSSPDENEECPAYGTNCPEPPVLGPVVPPTDGTDEDFCLYDCVDVDIDNEVIVQYAESDGKTVDVVKSDEALPHTGANDIGIALALGMILLGLGAGMVSVPHLLTSRV